MEATSTPEASGLASPALMYNNPMSRPGGEEKQRYTPPSTQFTSHRPVEGNYLPPSLEDDEEEGEGQGIYHLALSKELMVLV